MLLNVDKCFVVSYTRRTKHFIHFDYTIDGIVLIRKNNVKDLGVTYDGKCSFKLHIDEVCKKAKRSLGFVIRNSKDFSNSRTIKTLYCSFVRSTLEYASNIWSPTSTTHIAQLERVQHKFLRYLARKFHNDLKRQIDYEHYESLFKLQPLQLRRIISDVKFTIKCFNGTVESSSFVHHFSFLIPIRQTRQQLVFKPSTFDTTIDRIMRNYNDYCNDFDALMTRTNLNSVIDKIVGIYYQ